jgi:uncharacterized protein
VKIDINKVSHEGVLLSEEIMPQELDLDTEIVKFCSPIKVQGQAYKITNTVVVSLSLNVLLATNCCRCLEDLKIDFNKSIQLNYPVEKNEFIIDLNPDLRQELILDSPLKPLCKPDCKGLCAHCGADLNKEKCRCV